MILNLDYYFTYKYTLRYILIQKLNIKKNIYTIPNINKIIMFFFFKKYENLDSVELYNCFYFFKYFFGKKVFFTKTYLFYSLGKNYYNFNIQIILNKSKENYLITIYLKNNIINSLDKLLIKKGLINNTLYFINLKDNKIFSEMKTNLGLFNLKNLLNINIYLLGCNKLYNKIFIINLKI